MCREGGGSLPTETDWTRSNGMFGLLVVLRGQPKELRVSKHLLSHFFDLSHRQSRIHRAIVSLPTIVWSVVGKVSKLLLPVQSLKDDSS